MVIATTCMLNATSPEEGICTLGMLIYAQNRGNWRNEDMQVGNVIPTFYKYTAHPTYNIICLRYCRNRSTYSVVTYFNSYVLFD